MSNQPQTPRLNTISWPELKESIETSYRQGLMKILGCDAHALQDQVLGTWVGKFAVKTIHEAYSVLHKYALGALAPDMLYEERVQAARMWHSASGCPTLDEVVGPYYPTCPWKLVAKATVARDRFYRGEMLNATELAVMSSVGLRYIYGATYDGKLVRTGKSRYRYNTVEVRKWLCSRGIPC